MPIREEPKQVANDFKFAEAPNSVTTVMEINVATQWTSTYYQMSIWILNAAEGERKPFVHAIKPSVRRICSSTASSLGFRAENSDASPSKLLSPMTHPKPRAVRDPGSSFSVAPVQIWAFFWYMLSRAMSTTLVPS